MPRMDTTRNTTDTTRRDAVITRTTGGRHAYMDTTRHATGHGTRTDTTGRGTVTDTTTDTTGQDDTRDALTIARDLFLWGMVN